MSENIAQFYIFFVTTRRPRKNVRHKKKKKENKFDILSTINEIVLILNAKMGLLAYQRHRQLSHCRIVS